jgi:hypothetical protein
VRRLFKSFGVEELKQTVQILNCVTVVVLVLRVSVLCDDCVLSVWPSWVAGRTAVHDVLAT